MAGEATESQLELHCKCDSRVPAPMTRRLQFSLISTLFLLDCGPSRENRIVVGSKTSPNKAVLGEIFAQQLEAKTNLHVERRFYLAGSFICQQAILAGRIDVYPEYTGTALTAILKEKTVGTRQEVLPAGEIRIREAL